MTKKIDVIVKYFVPVIAGIEVNILETYSRLVEKGWEVTIHTSNDLYLEKNCLAKTDRIRGLKVQRYPWKWYGLWPQLNWWGDGIIALHNFDIFPFFQVLLFTLLLKLTGLKKFKLILTPHGGFNPEWSIFTKAQEVVKKTYSYTLGAWLIKNTVDLIRAVSVWERKEIISKGIPASSVFTIANGLEDEAFDEDDSQVSPAIKKLVKSWGRYIFGDARIYSIKNQETIIKALPFTPSNIKFVNIGAVEKKDYPEKLVKLAKQLHVEDRVIFPGIVRGADKYYLYRQALMFVHMAKWESFCNVVHQAISQGLVCIVANNTALPLLVKNKINGYLVPTYDYKTLAKRINYVLTNLDSDEIKTIRANNRRDGLRNSWRNTAERVSDLYINSSHQLTILTEALASRGYRVTGEVRVDDFNRYHVAVTNSNGEKFIVKALVGTRGYSYLSLLNEAYLAKHLAGVTQKQNVSADGYRLKIPRVADIIKEDKVLAVVAERINGSQLSTKSEAVQAKLLVTVDSLLTKLSTQVKCQDIADFTHDYSIPALRLTLALKLARAIQLAPQNAGDLVKTALTALGLISSRHKSSGLVHPDLNASNLFVNKKVMYLLDWEEAGWGENLYNQVCTVFPGWDNGDLRNNFTRALDSRFGSMLLAMLAYRTLIDFCQTNPRVARHLKVLKFVTTARLSTIKS